MFFDLDKYSYYVAPGGTDMRKGADSLARMVCDSLMMDPMSKSMLQIETIKATKAMIYGRPVPKRRPENDRVNGQRRSRLELESQDCVQVQDDYQGAID